jgi:hypothetical protein
MVPQNLLRATVTNAKTTKNTIGADTAPSAHHNTGIGV